MTKNFNISDLHEYLNEDILLKYINNELSEEDVEKVEFLLKNDIMYSDLLDGLLMLDNPEDIFSEKSELDKKVDAFSRNIKRQKERRYLKFRSVSAIILLILISIIVFIIAANINNNSVHKLTDPEKSGNDYDEILYLEEKVTKKVSMIDTTSKKEPIPKITGFIISEESLHKENEEQNEYDQNYEIIINDSITLKDSIEELYEEEEIVFVVLEDKREFPGGEAALLRYITENISYPEKAKRSGKEGTVHIQFTVDGIGKVTNVKVVKGVDPELDKEAVRVIENMPRWSPGRARGKSEPETFTISIRFKLE